MRGRNKVIVGLASVAAAACVVDFTTKVADHIRKKLFAQGYEAGHFVGFMDGGITMAQEYDEVVKTASELGKKHSALAEKYSDLCEEYDELEREYGNLCDKYDEA